MLPFGGVIYAAVHMHFAPCLEMKVHKMPLSYMIMLQPTQHILLSTFCGAGGGECYNILFFLPTLCSMFTVCATVKQLNHDSECVLFACFLPVC
jgi:hypothetical protein